MPFDFLGKGRELWRSLTLRYWLALGTIGVFSVGMHFLFVSSLDSQRSDSVTIDLSVRLQLLSERIVHLGWQLAESESPESRRAWRDSLRLAVDDLEDRYQELLLRSVPIEESKRPNSLDLQLRQFLEDGRALLEVSESDLASGSPNLARLKESLGPLIEEQKRLTALYERGLRESVADIKNLSFAAIVVSLCLLLLLGLLVFRPIAGKAKAEMTLLADSEALVRSILHASLDAIVIVDDKGLIHEWNPGAESLFGWSRSEVMGRRLEETIIPPSRRERHTEGMEQFLITGVSSILDKRVEFSGLVRDGAEIPLELTIVFLRKGGGRFFCYFIRDLTSQKQVQAEIEKHRKHLEKLLWERGRQLEENYLKLKAAERMAAIGEVAAKVAHEIRNPLAAIQGTVRLLIKGLNLNSSQEDLRSDLMVEIRRLDETVKDLLDFSRPLVPKKVSTELGVYVDELLDYWKLQPAIAKHAIEVEIDPDLKAVFDLHLMNEVLTNLVLNAAQSMERPDVIRIKAGREGAAIYLEVSDSGSGIPEGSLPLIFTPFFTTKSQGTGLGLAIAKKNVEAMGGTIQVRSAPGKGASFMVLLSAADTRSTT